MLGGFLKSVPPLRHGARALSTAARTTDGPTSSDVMVNASRVVTSSITSIDLFSTGQTVEHDVKDTPFAKQVPEQAADNAWALPSVAALHADLARVQAIRAEAEPPAQPAFAPVNVTALQADFAKVHLAEEAQAAAEVWALPSAAALHADFAKMQAMRAEAEPTAHPASVFAPANVAALHADFAKMQSVEENHVAEEPQRNVWAMPSVTALHADVELMQTLIDEAAPPAVNVAAAPANPFAPHSVSALHDDLAKMGAIRADLDAVPELASQMQAQVPAFAPVAISRLHEDFANMQALSEAAEFEVAI